MVHSKLHVSPFTSRRNMVDHFVESKFFDSTKWPTVLIFKRFSKTSSSDPRQRVPLSIGLIAGNDILPKLV